MYLIKSIKWWYLIHGRFSIYFIADIQSIFDWPYFFNFMLTYVKYSSPPVHFNPRLKYDAYQMHDKISRKHCKINRLVKSKNDQQMPLKIVLVLQCIYVMFKNWKRSKKLKKKHKICSRTLTCRLSSRIRKEKDYNKC